LQKLSQNTSPLTRKDSHYEVSIYEGELTTDCVINNIAKLKKAFPALPKEFYDVLADRIKEHNFNNQRLSDSIDSVIDNCVYPTPTIAQFIGYDEKINLYNYHDIIKMNDKTGIAFKCYRPIKYKDLSKPLYASVEDIERFNLEKWHK